jgi:hypothetical protein
MFNREKIPSSIITALFIFKASISWADIIHIDNYSGDTITVLVGHKEVSVLSGYRKSIDTLECGTMTQYNRWRIEIKEFPGYSEFALKDGSIIQIFKGGVMDLVY